MHGDTRLVALSRHRRMRLFADVEEPLASWPRKPAHPMRLRPATGPPRSVTSVKVRRGSTRIALVEA
jgi:hypothetical protein